MDCPIISFLVMTEGQTTIYGVGVLFGILLLGICNEISKNAL
ncbi:hypothetical protein [uncultured Helicobacter sp.]|nr:hypothetical protein [uncultured Helicobacter sp.]